MVIATWWETAEWVNDFPASKGRKFYLIQHHEIHPYLPLERVQATSDYSASRESAQRMARLYTQLKSALVEAGLAKE